MWSNSGSRCTNLGESKMNEIYTKIVEVSKIDNTETFPDIIFKED